jgi:S1-C subfamily serine protease
MQEIVMLETIERYIRGEMLPEERVFFEQLRKSNPEVDQKVVEHTIFLNQMNKFAERRQLKATLMEVHNELYETGAIRENGGAKVVKLWRKYKRVVAVAACIAGVTALIISGLVSYLTPKADNKYVEQLSRKISVLEQKQNSLSANLNETKTIINKTISRIPPDATVKLGGTGFLIDAKGYLVTNAHVVSNAQAVVVQNTKGQQFSTKVILVDPVLDLAFLKIDDDDYKAVSPLPYGISKANGELGEQIFTMGYPRDEIVYGEGYLSAKTGYEGDTLAFQIAVAANPGNSGGPVLDKNGDVIGIISTRQNQAQGVVFAVRAKNIFRALDEMKTDSLALNLKIAGNSTLKGMERVQQIKKIEDCIYIVKSY